MRINFVLPPNSNKPVGGFKIVFQYANELVSRGNDVHITFLINLSNSKFRKILSKIKEIILNDRNKRRITWFDIDHRVKIHYDLIFKNEFPEADVIIATAVHTAYVVNGLDAKYGKKFYFIQGRDTWDKSKEFVNETYLLPMSKIVVSHWLYKIVKKYSKDDIKIIPNFLENNSFYSKKSILDRKDIVSIMYHEMSEKNVRFGIRVLEKVKECIPNLEVRMFGVFTPPSKLPSYFKYYYQPSHEVLNNEIYGESVVFLNPSLSEGWGLTGMEAMASGAVVVSSKIDGVLEYCENNVNSILIEPNDFNGFVGAIIRVMGDVSEKSKLSYNGISTSKKFNVSRSTDMLLNAFSGGIN